MLNILLLITKAEIGGAQMSVLNLAKELKKQGHTVSVAFGDGDFLPAELSKANIPFFRFKHLKRTHNPLVNLFFILEFKNFLNKNDFDVVHINSSNALLGGLAAKLSKKKPKTVFTFRGLSLLDPNYKKSPYLKTLYRLYFNFFLRFIDKQIYVSNFNLNNRRGLASTNNTVIYNGLDLDNLEFYSKEQAQERLGKHLQTDLSNRLLIGTIGRLCYAKNQEFLIKIFPKILKILPSATLIIIGDGEEKTRLLKLTRKYTLENNIFFCGSLNNAGKYIKAFDIFTLPSRYEGLSITLIEALSAGVPILASEVGGNSESLGNKEAQLFELDNMDEYIDKLEKIIIDREIYQQLVNFNLTLAEKFDIRKTVEEYLKIYIGNS